MTDTSIYWSTLVRHSVSESDNDLLNCTVNPQSNPSRFILPDWAESNPNVSVSGFIDESPYTDPGTHLQSQQNRLEISPGPGKLWLLTSLWKSLPILSLNVLRPKISLGPENVWSLTWCNTTGLNFPPTVMQSALDWDPYMFCSSISITSKVL